jgi:hypothetical protein
MDYIQNNKTDLTWRQGTRGQVAVIPEPVPVVAIRKFSEEKKLFNERAF